MVNWQKIFATTADNVISGAKNLVPDIRAGVAHIKENALPDILPTFNRAVQSFPIEQQKQYFSANTKVGALQARYLHDYETFSDTFRKLSVPDKIVVMKAIGQKGRDTEDAIAAFNKYFPQGAPEKFQAMTHDYIQDPLASTVFPTNKKFLPGVKQRLGKSVISPNGTEIIEMPKHYSLDDGGYSDEAIAALAADPDYNLFDEAVKNAHRKLDKFTVLGYSYHPKDLNPDGTLSDPNIRADLRPFDDVEIPGRVTLANSVMDAAPEMSQGRARVAEGVLKALNRTTDKGTVFDKINQNALYGLLVNNVGTLVRSLPDAVKTTASNGDLYQAAKRMADDKTVASSLISLMSDSTKHSTELGRPIGKQWIPDLTAKGEQVIKGHIVYANALSKARELDPKNAGAIISNLEDILSGKRKVEYTPLDNLSLDALTHGMEEAHRTASKITAIDQRPMFQGVMGLLKLSETAINDSQELAKAAIGTAKGDKEAKKKLAAYGRSAAVRAALFGAPTLVAKEAIDFVQDKLPEEEQAKLQNARNALNKVSLITGPASLIGMDTTTLTQPVIDPVPFISGSGFPVFTDIQNVTGNGAAVSEKGKATSGVSSGVKLASLLGRTVAPNNPLVQVVSSLNPSATGRVAYEALRTAGVAPDSVSPGVYELRKGVERSQTPISYVNALLGTSPDYNDKQTQLLNKVFAK